MKILDRTQKLYMLIIHAIWAILTYYEQLFGLIIPQVPQDLDCTIGTDAYNTRHLYIKIRVDPDCPSIYDRQKIKEIVNDYIQFSFPTEYPEIKPFSVDKTAYGTIEALYLFDVKKASDLDYSIYDFIFIDSPLAFEEVLADRNGGVKV